MRYSLSPRCGSTNRGKAQVMKPELSRFSMRWSTAAQLSCLAVIISNINRVCAGGGFIGSTTCIIYETMTMKRASYKCNVAEAGDIHHIYTRVSLPSGTFAESSVYNNTEYGNRSRIVLKGIISIFAEPPYKNMGKQCAMLPKNKLLCYK